MGFLKKLTKKTLGGKITSKLIAHDPIGKKVLGKSKLMQATGLVPGKQRPAPAAPTSAPASSSSTSRGAPSTTRDGTTRTLSRKKFNS
jgi:hypothetical protein